MKKYHLIDGFAQLPTFLTYRFFSTDRISFVWKGNTKTNMKEK